jgi:hypothetical protein
MGSPDVRKFYVNNQQLRMHINVRMDMVLAMSHQYQKLPPPSPRPVTVVVTAIFFIIITMVISFSELPSSINMVSLGTFPIGACSYPSRYVCQKSSQQFCSVKPQ